MATRSDLGATLGFRQFWSKGIRNLGGNVVRISPILFLISLYSIGSATVLYFAERGANPNVSSWWKAFYLTWATITTVGNPGPQSATGMLLTPLDGLVGVIILGIVVWLVTFSLDPRP